MIKNKLTKEDIESIKKNIVIKEIDEDVLEKHNWININDLFLKITRTVKEELILFQQSVDFLEKIDDGKVKLLLGEVYEIKQEVNKLMIGANYRLEVFGAELIRKKRDEINYLVWLVFGEFLNKEEGEIGEID